MHLLMENAVFCALMSAFLFALSIHVQHFGLESANPRVGSLISIIAAAISFWLMSPLFLERWYFFTGAFLLFCLVGIFRPSLSSFLALSSVKLMGPTLTSALTSTAPLFGALFAILLGERLTLPIIAGTAAIVAGAIIATHRPEGVERSWPLWALALPIGAAFIRASGHALTKIGLTEVPSPVFAAMIGDTVSVLVAGTAFKAQGLRIGRARGLVWFAAAGIINGVSLIFLNSALQTGALSVVVPLVGSTPVFALLLGLIVFRHEVFSWRTLATIALIVPGVALVALR